MTTHGFFLGKFMPVHAGHLLCAEVGKARCDVMTVLVCSTDSEPIDGEIRAQWVRDCLPQKGYRVIHMHRDIPQEPDDHPDFWAIWRAAIKEHHPEPIDWVFGSDDYVKRLASEVGARPFLVDQDRKAVPVSATKIRNAPQQHWDQIPAPVRPYYQRRLVLLGAESTGKSVMSHALAKRLNTVPIPEYGRDYDVLFRPSEWRAEHLYDIIAGHKALADSMAKRDGPIVIEDTDAVQTLVWTEALLGDAPPEMIDLARQAIAGKIYLLLDHSTKWHDDGVRYFPDQEKRAFFTERLAHWLNAFGADWTLISGSDRNARQAAGHARLDAFLSAESEA